MKPREDLQAAESGSCLESASTSEAPTTQPHRLQSIHTNSMTDLLPTPLATTEADHDDSSADTATSVAESVLIDMSTHDKETTKVTCALPKLAVPSFVFLDGHKSTWQRYAGKRGVKPWAKASRLKKRPSRSRWAFSLENGLALEGLPLMHSGCSNLLDEMALKVEAV